MDHATRRELIALGVTDRELRQAVLRGELIRLRRGHYARPTIDRATACAVRVGGRLACVSELRHRDVWVLDDDVVHVQVPAHATRLRHVGRPIRLHWKDDEIEARVAGHVGIVRALTDAFHCLSTRAWIASADSALHLGLVSRGALTELRASLPRAAHAALDLLDRRSESGLESIVRVIATELGFHVRPQVRIPGVGRVDLVIEKWIVVETDGTAFHDTALSARDRWRDARAAGRGMTVLRPGYSLVVFEQEIVARQLIGAVAAHRRVKNSGYLVARARRRMARMDFSGVVDTP